MNKQEYKGHAQKLKKNRLDIGFKPYFQYLVLKKKCI